MRLLPLVVVLMVHLRYAVLVPEVTGMQAVLKVRDDQCCASAAALVTVTC